MPTSNDYLADLGVALELAALADVISTARFGASDLHVETKPDLTPVSDADRAVETAIRSRLAEVRPDDAVLGEEFGNSAGGSSTGRRWVVDPIDGTKNFVRGVPVWATLIALLDDDDDDDDSGNDSKGAGRAVVGVVSAPALGRRWWAYRGGGAWRGEPGLRPRRLAVSGVGRLEDASLSYSSIAGWGATGQREAFLALTDRVWRTRAYGDFWSYLLVAEGAVDLAAEPELSLWDMAALAPIVTEAGGRFSGLNGRDGVHEGNAAASNGLLHKAFLAALTPPSRPAKAASAAAKSTKPTKAGRPAAKSGKSSKSSKASTSAKSSKPAQGGGTKPAAAGKPPNARGTRRTGA